MQHFFLILKYIICYILFCRFTELPEAIYNVVSLESLIANDNLIVKIDVPLLEKLKKLAVLNLTNNNIAHVPPELGNLKNLRLYKYYILVV